MKSDIKIPLGLGICSLIMIFITLTMVVLTSLNLMSAYKAKEQTEKTISYVQAYYVAEKEAYHQWLELEGKVVGTAQQLQIGETVSYSIVITQSQSLVVTLRWNGTEFEREKWQVINESTWQPEDAVDRKSVV